MARLKDEVRAMASGFRWGRRPLVPRSAEPYREETYDEGFPTDWARTELGVAARQIILDVGIRAILTAELSLRVYGDDLLADTPGPVIFFSNHSSHLDATLIMSTLPDRWQRRTAVGAARDYFFDVWWRQVFTALVYGAFPIDRGRGAVGAIDKARELVREGWSIVVFPEGTRSLDGHMQRFRHGAARLALELGVNLVPIAIIGAAQAMPKGKWWPRTGRPPVTIRYGPLIVPEEGESHQSLSIRMQQAVAQLFDEERTNWYDAMARAQRGQTPSLAGPAGPDWLKTWEGTRPVKRQGVPRTWV
jgi:1-acyl-sn-glycerol-3-phosphate acyltransferase